MIAVGVGVAALGLALSARAVDRMDATYINGTAKAVPEEARAALDTSSTAALELHAGATTVPIPYSRVTSYEYRVENRFRLGALPAVAVGLLKAREKRHLLTIAWTDDQGNEQTATFETTRDRARGLIKVLDIRSPQVAIAHKRHVDCQPEL
jgi:hypothetical protein